MNGNILSEVSISLIKMTPKVKHNHLSTHRSVILHYYNLGHRCTAELLDKQRYVYVLSGII